MPEPELPLTDMTQGELLREIAGNLRYLRRLLSEYEPLLPAIKQAAGGNAIRAAGLRRALKNGARDAASQAHV